MNTRIFTSILTGILMHYNAFARESNDSELTFGYGYYSLQHMSSESFSNLGTAFTFGSVQQENFKSSGIVYLSFSRALSKVWLFGVALSYEQFTESYLSGGFLFLTAPTSRTEIKSKNLTIAIENHFRYVRNPKFQMYSGIGVGYTMIKEKYSGNANQVNETSGIPNVHFNFIGLRIGKEVALKLEFGLGYKGIINGGLSVKL